MVFKKLCQKYHPSKQFRQYLTIQYEFLQVFCRLKQVFLKYHQVFCPILSLFDSDKMSSSWSWNASPNHTVTSTFHYRVGANWSIGCIKFAPHIMLLTKNLRAAGLLSSFLTNSFCHTALLIVVWCRFHFYSFSPTVLTRMSNLLAENVYTVLIGCILINISLISL